jgi:transposase
MDEARVGQKGRTGYRWWLRGKRPRGLCDRRFESAYIFGAVRPATGDTMGLILPTVSTETMQIFLDEFAARLAADAQAVLVLDGAGWHGSGDLVVPKRVSLVRLPPYAPELNPVERIWLYLRERCLSHRVFADYDDILQACADAWQALTRETSRSLTAFPWLEQISS